MVNSVILLGRLVADVDTKTTKEGVVIQNFTLAVTTGRDTDGNDIASFFNCVAFDNKAIEYLSKGDRTIVTGRLNQRHYTNKEKKEVYVVEILVNSVELIEPKKDEDDEAEEPAPKAQVKKPYRK